MEPEFESLLNNFYNNYKKNIQTFIKEFESIKKNIDYYLKRKKALLKIKKN